MTEELVMKDIEELKKELTIVIPTLNEEEFIK